MRSGVAVGGGGGLSGPWRPLKKFGVVASMSNPLYISLNQVSNFSLGIPLAGHPPCALTKLSLFNEICANVILELRTSTSIDIFLQRTGKFCASITTKDEPLLFHHLSRNAVWWKMDVSLILVFKIFYKARLFWRQWLHRYNWHSSNCRTVSHIYWLMKLRRCVPLLHFNRVLRYMKTKYYINRYALK